MKIFLKLNTRFMAVFLIAFIILLTLGIFIFNQKTANLNLIGNNLKDYSTIKTKYNSFKLSNQSIQKNTTLQFNILENKNSTPSDDYKATTQIAFFMSEYYSLVNDNNIYNYITKDLNSFAKNNFPKEYNASDFLAPCMDAICAKSKAPKEISDIINEINVNKQIPEGQKKPAIQNLYNAIFSNNDNKFAKAGMYFVAASNIRQDPDFIKAGVNDVIADKIDLFIKTSYPDAYAQLVKSSKTQ